MLAGEIQVLKTKIESSNASVTKLSQDIIRQARLLNCQNGGWMLPQLT